MSSVGKSFPGLYLFVEITLVRLLQPTTVPPLDVFGPNYKLVYKILACDLNLCETYFYF
jgi:hypothetical protein